MTNRFQAARLQPVMVSVALVATALAAVALVLSGSMASQQSEVREQLSALSSLAQNIPLQAGAAVRGSAPAFDSLAESRARLESVLAGVDPGEAGTGDPAAWAALLEQSQAVLDGRAAALEAQRSSAGVRELTPQLLAAAANVAKAAGTPRPEALNGHLERFALRAQAVQQDLAALADGTSTVEAASRRLVESLDYLGRVAAGLAGPPNELGIAQLPPAASETAAGSRRSR